MKWRIQEAARHASHLTRQQVPPILKAVDRTGTEIGRALAAHVSQEKAISVNDLLSDRENKSFNKISKSILTKSMGSLESLKAPDRPRAPREGDGPIFEPSTSPVGPSPEIAMAAVLKQLSTVAPKAVEQLFRPSLSKFDRAIGAAALFANSDAFNPANEVYLSPIGLLHQFRQYFFQLGTFIGPPVGHVWISPGGSIDLVEVNTRKKLVESTMELSTTSVSKSESSCTDKDELSDAVKNENSNDMKLEASATASGGIGPVFQASGTASFNLDISRKQAREATHKKMREQSAKLTSEVTQNYKTTFRTATETTDTSSRRYILQNNTQRLVSYELSRKMRKVGVQVQDLGQRLCFQLFVENPGNPLGVGEFVHSTAEALDASIKLPEEQEPPPPKLVTVSENFPYLVTFDDKELSSDFYPDPENPTGGIHNEGGKKSRIDFRLPFKLPPAPEGYQNPSIKQVDFKGANVKLKPNAYELNPADGTYVIHLTYANFGGKEPLPFDLLVQYEPNEEMKKRIDEKNKKNQKIYDDQLADAKQNALFDTLRTRLKLASQVQAREYDVLREEERHVISSKLIQILYGDESGFDAKDYYAASEMIRYYFDVDALLYFVARDWWKPQSFVMTTTVTTTVNKDGSASTAVSSIPLSMRARLAGHEPDKQIGKVRQTYLMSDETRPAPLGASLGWLMQVDGDTQRNAFLNSPWVKAVLPIRPGREAEALAFLQRREVAGAEGLDENYPYDETKDPENFSNRSWKEVLLLMAKAIKDEYDTSMKPVPAGKDKVDNARPGAGVSPRMALPTETVFAHGYDPLPTGIDFDREAFKVFSEWTEIVPTDQVVATEYSLQGL